MSETSENAVLGAHPVIAERVCQQLQVFPRKFKELGEGGELEDVLTSPAKLSGPKIHQAPEDFTEQYLIEPLLHSLGYLNPISEKYDGEGPHFVRRPTTFRKVEGNRPDYRLRNLSEDIVCILEAKAANRERPRTAVEKATEDIKAYVESNTFSKYLKSRDQRYLVGIGTDGIRWSLWVKDVRAGETKQRVKEISLIEPLLVIARQENVISGDSETSRPEMRRRLASEFTPVFAARSLPAYVRSQFE